MCSSLPLTSVTGTQTLLRGQQYCINVAFLRDGVEELGIIGCPNLRLDSSTASEDVIDEDGLGLMLFAVRGQGTWMRPMQHGSILADPARVQRHGDHATMDKLTWSDCSTYTSTITHLHQQVAAKLGTPWPGVDLYSSVLKYAALGLGLSSICIRIFKFASWRSNMCALINISLDYSADVSQVGSCRWCPYCY
jgi:3'(2'), 5'-bisphosphate nucleotidase